MTEDQAIPTSLGHARRVGMSQSHLRLYVSRRQRRARGLSSTPFLAFSSLAHTRSSVRILDEQIRQIILQHVECQLTYRHSAHTESCRRIWFAAGCIDRMHG